MNPFISEIPNPPPQDVDENIYDYVENEELVAIDEAIEANAQEMDWMPEDVVNEWLFADQFEDQDQANNFEQNIIQDLVAIFGDEDDDNFQNEDIFQINLQPEEDNDLHLFADNNVIAADLLPPPENVNFEFLWWDFLDENADDNEEADENENADDNGDADIYFQEPVSHPA